MLEALPPQERRHLAPLFLALRARALPQGWTRERHQETTDESEPTVQEDDP